MLDLSKCTVRVTENRAAELSWGRNQLDHNSCHSALRHRQGEETSQALDAPRMTLVSPFPKKNGARITSIQSAERFFLAGTKRIDYAKNRSREQAKREQYRHRDRSFGVSHSRRTESNRLRQRLKGA